MTCLLLLLLVCLWGPADADASTREDITRNFDEDRPGQLPPKFMIGTFSDGRLAGDWKVITTPKALSPSNVFAQSRAKGAGYNIVLIDNAQAANLDLSVSFLPISGKTDMGAGSYGGPPMIGTTISRAPIRWSRTSASTMSSRAFGR